MTKLPQLNKTSRKKQKNEQEIAVLKILRKNSRAKIAQIARELDISSAKAFTLFSRTTRKYVLKYSSLIDFEKMGHIISSLFIITPPADEKNNAVLINFFRKSRHINTMNLASNDNLIIESYFSNMVELVDFRHFIEEIADFEEHEIISEIRKEGFLV